MRAHVIPRLDRGGKILPVSRQRIRSRDSLRLHSLTRTSGSSGDIEGVDVEGVPLGQESSAGSETVLIEILDEHQALRAQLPPCPDWPDLN